MTREEKMAQFLTLTRLCNEGEASPEQWQAWRALKDDLATTDEVIKRMRERAFPRIALGLEVRGQLGQASSTYTIIDLGAGGMMLEEKPGAVRPEVGERLQLSLVLPPGDLYLVAAQVAWRGEGARFGVRFVELDEGLREEIRAFVLAELILRKHEQER